jgi:hypothetical protein
MMRRPRWWPSTGKAGPVPSYLPASDQCLFVIGAARSGTTVLQNALNESPDLFLFGEPNFHDEGDAPGFAARYNAMHRGWANQETKSTFCPPVLPDAAAWNDYVRHLGALHRYVGAKIVIVPGRDRAYLDRLFDFHCRHFYRSRYIFTFRAPAATVLSTRDLQLFAQGQSDGLRPILTGYAQTAALYVRMSRNLSHVCAVFHEDIDRSVFDDLARWLDVPLPRSHLYYEKSKVRHHADLDPATDGFDLLQAVQGIYEQLRTDARTGFRALQIEQNDHHLDGSHFTAMGKIQRDLDAVLRDLAPKG